MLAIRLYDAIVAVHVIGVVTAFGVTFAYPILIGYVKRTHPHAMAALHAGQDQLGKLVITPAMVLVLVSGAYLASDADVWDRPWTGAPLLVILILFGLGGGFFSPQERKLEAMAERDIAASTGATVEFSAEYEALYARVRAVGLAAATLVVIAVFVMVTKPGGY